MVQGHWWLPSAHLQCRDRCICGPWCVCALVEYWLRGGDVVNYSLPTNIWPPIRDDCNTVWFLYYLLDLHLNSASSKLVDKACLVGGVYAGRRTFRNFFQYPLPVSIRGEPVAYTARARHSSAFLWLRSSIESKNLLIPAGPWAVAIDKVILTLNRSRGTFVRGCLLWALRELYALGQMIMHFCCILRIWSGTVFANVHSFSIYISYRELSPHVR